MRVGLARVRTWLRLRLLFSARTSVRKAELRVPEARKQERNFSVPSASTASHFSRTPGGLAIFEFSNVVFLQGLWVSTVGIRLLLYLLAAQLAVQLASLLTVPMVNVSQIHASG